jgi:hypothetical protein
LKTAYILVRHLEMPFVRCVAARQSLQTPATQATRATIALPRFAVGKSRVIINLTSGSTPRSNQLTGACFEVRDCSRLEQRR